MLAIPMLENSSKRTNRYKIDLTNQVQVLPIWSEKFVFIQEGPLSRKHGIVAA